jgi:hypothetical protein
VWDAMNHLSCCFCASSFFFPVFLIRYLLHLTTLMGRELSSVCCPCVNFFLFISLAMLLSHNSRRCYGRCAEFSFLFFFFLAILFES